MSYIDFSTENADYRLILSTNHRLKNEEPVSGLDAVVLEGRSVSMGKEIKMKKLEDTIENHSVSFRNKQYKNIIETAMKNGISLYQVDVAPKINSIFERPYFERLLSRSLSLINAIQKKEKVSPSLVDFIGVYNWFIQAGYGELRNAVLARKTEEFIAPQLQKRLGRRPKIGVVYGGYHAGIKHDLKYKRMRDLTLLNHKYLNILPYFRLAENGIENLNSIEEANYKDGDWVVKKHNLGDMF